MGKKEKAAAAAVAVAAAAGMVTGAVFDSPAELVQDVLPIAEEQRAEEAAPREERQKGPAARLRSWVLRRSAAVRMLVGVPLWGVGWVIMTGLSTLWMGVTTPAVSGFLNWLCLAAVLFAVFSLSVKAAFPSLRLKEIVRSRNLLLLLGITVLLAAADLALPTVWEGYGPGTQTLWRLGAACLLGCCCYLELKHQGKRSVARKGSQRTEVEEAARALADTVCPPRW